MCAVTLGSVFRSVLLAMRTLLIWGANLGIFYVGIGGGHLGEGLSSGSPYQLLGCMLLLMGTMLYSQVRPCCVHRPPPWSQNQLY